MPAAVGNRIGVLNLQGDVFEHLDHLERLEIPARTVKEAADFEDLAGLIIPGGESTCISRLLKIFGLTDAIVDAHGRGVKIWGTCAGAILLAKSVVGEASHLGLIDMVVERNSFGSQLDSFSAEAFLPRISPVALPLTFIRAPKIIQTGPGVEVLLRREDYIAAAESPGVLVTTFHPELTPCMAFHRYFARKCALPARQDIPDVDPAWTNRRWTRHARIH